MSGCNFDLAPGGDDHNSVAIEVSAGQPLRHLGVDANSVKSVAQDALRLTLLVVHLKNWNLEGAAMRITDKRDGLAIPVIGGVDLSVLHRSNRKDDLILLSRQSRCLKVYGR